MEPPPRLFLHQCLELEFSELRSPAEQEQLRRLLLDLRYASDQQGGDVTENVNNGAVPVMVQLKRIVSASGPPRLMVWRPTPLLSVKLPI
jgi:hypothetical protein